MIKYHTIPSSKFAGFAAYFDIKFGELACSFLLYKPIMLNIENIKNVNRVSVNDVKVE